MQFIQTRRRFWPPLQWQALPASSVFRSYSRRNRWKRPRFAYRGTLVVPTAGQVRTSPEN